jgi:hypothetical protein
MHDPPERKQLEVLLAWIECRLDLLTLDEWVELLPAALPGEYADLPEPPPPYLADVYSQAERVAILEARQAGEFHLWHPADGRSAPRSRSRARGNRDAPRDCCF